VSHSAQLEVIKMLIDRPWGSTALLAATSYGSIETVKFLLQCQANVNQATTDDNASPLFVAALDNRVEIMKLLINAKAEVNFITYRL